ncbi:M28 family metallopeptidase [Roseovarius aestuariivivens]|uniref:M28 family metallopeptidase n=1 Tax=Roseovarius aestuariivivens TaxID=1888910 RepID=UPI001AEC2947|nr:M28 family metallopeptidase [Roseovarius aestuariivivens]
MGAWWVRFGEDVFVYAADSKWRSVADSLGRADPEGDVRKGDMHLVVQKGRVFQLENPDVPVLMDKGRFLVVELDSATAKRLGKRDEPCFHIEPLRENSVVFETLAPKARSAPASAVVRIVEDLSRATLEKSLSKLVSFRTRHSLSAEFQDAATWARDRLTEYGMTTDLVEIDVAGRTSLNVVGRKPGTGTDKQAVLVVAHLDSVNAVDGPDAPAPGADDNASGSAGLLVLAEAMGKRNFDHDLIFILFGGEEQGLHGSVQYVSTLDTAERDRIKAVLNMDMIGTINSDPQSVLLEGADLSQSMIYGLATAAAQVTSLSVQTSLNPFASDHVPFIRAGIPAVLTIEGADSANDSIHTADDILSHVNPGFSMEILRMNAAYLAIEAGIATDAPVAEPEPAGQPVGGCSCGCTGLGDALSADEIARTNQLAAHYQALFAQYARLHNEGKLTHFDFTQWQQARAAYSTAMAAAGRGGAPGQW